MSQPIFKPRTFNGDLAHLPHALLPLTRMQHWVVWRWQARTGKGQVRWTKPPFQIADPNRLAKSNQPGTWGSYEDAIPIVAAGNSDGIGFQLSGSHILAVDLDHIRDMTTGEITPRAQELIAEAANVGGVYIEVTVSGTGVRFIGLANNAEEIHRKYTLDPATGEAIELYRNCARYITVSGLLADLPSCPVLDVVDGFFEQLQARLDVLPPRTVPGFDFNDAGPQIDYRDLIENGAPEGERSELFQAVVWHLAGQGMSADEIADELGKHPAGIGAKYAGRLLAEAQRSHAKWQTHRRNTATGNPAAGHALSWPQIRIIPGEIPRIVDEAEDALLLLSREIYQRGGIVVRPVLTKFKASNERDIQGWHLVPVTQPYLVDTLTCAAQFMKHDARSKKWVAIDAPDKVAEIYLARQGRWKLPVLSGVIHTPFLRADGSICEQPGYDPVSGLLFKPEGENYPSIPLQPSKSAAVVALGKLAELIKEFPFVQDKDRSVALSAILTTLDRRSMATAPLHAFTSPAAGTGKSLLVDVCAMLATGRAMPVISQGGSEEEFEKRLSAALLAGDTAISLDNCDREVGGSFLCQVLTQRHLNIRILGLSRNAETPVNATIFVTGNNLVIAGDATRRSLLSAMDAGVERPETRKFSSNVIEIARQRRGELVAAALTVLRAWHVSGERMTLSPFGSFEEWSYRIREPLMWLGQIDPCETLLDVRKSDPQRDELVAVLIQWELHLGTNHRHTVREVIERAVNAATFYAALMSVAGSRSGQSVSNDRLGRWLKRVQGKIANGLALAQDGIQDGYSIWTLKRR